MGARRATGTLAARWSPPNDPAVSARRPGQRHIDRGRSAALGGCRQPVRRRHSPRPRVEIGYLERLRGYRRRTVFKIALAGAITGRHPEFSRRRSALRHTGRPRVGRAHRASARHPRHPRRHSQPRRRCLRLPATATAVRRARLQRQPRAQGSLLAGGRNDLRRPGLSRRRRQPDPAVRSCRRGALSRCRGWPADQPPEAFAQGKFAARFRTEFCEATSKRSDIKRGRARSATPPRTPSSPCAARSNSGSRSPISTASA